MTEPKWRAFLQEWNRELRRASSRIQTAERAVKDISGGDWTADWLGYEGATEQELVTLEEQVGMALPPSYRSFLVVSNGFRQPNCFVPRIFSTGEVAWLHASSRDSIEAWIDGENYGGSPRRASDEEYFVYDASQHPESLRSEYLWESLQISDFEYAGTAVYLLNPAVTFSNGEWEAWFWAHWLPGARRYRSFWDLMQNERQSFIGLHAS